MFTELDLAGVINICALSGLWDPCCERKGVGTLLIRQALMSANTVVTSLGSTLWWEGAGLATWASRHFCTGGGGEWPSRDFG